MGGQGSPASKRENLSDLEKDAEGGFEIMRSQRAAPWHQARVEDGPLPGARPGARMRGERAEAGEGDAEEASPEESGVFEGDQQAAPWLDLPGQVLLTDKSSPMSCAARFGK